MTVRSSRAKFVPDYEGSVVLRDVTDGAETSTATETAVSLNELDGAYWDDGKDIPGGLVIVHLHITAADKTTGDEAYTFDLMVDDTSDLSNTPRSVATLTFAAGQISTGVYRMAFFSDQIQFIDTDSSGTDKWIAIKATLAGTTPSVTYGAWIGENRGA